MTLGSYPSMSLARAHKAHAEAVAQLEQGMAPGAAIVQERRVDRNAATVLDLASEYLEMNVFSGRMFSPSGNT